MCLSVTWNTSHINLCYLYVHLYMCGSVGAYMHAKANKSINIITLMLIRPVATGWQTPPLDNKMPAEVRRSRVSEGVTPPSFAEIVGNSIAFLKKLALRSKVVGNRLLLIDHRLSVSFVGHRSSFVGISGTFSRLLVNFCCYNPPPTQKSFGMPLHAIFMPPPKQTFEIFYC